MNFLQVGGLVCGHFQNICKLVHLVSEVLALFMMFHRNMELGLPTISNLSQKVALVHEILAFV